MLEHQKRKKNSGMIKNMGKHNRFSALQFSKVAEGKIITLFDVVPKICRGNLKGNYMISGGKVND